ncbi:MAG: OmpA family protein, partial [Pseudohongiellaceae bacterium]
MHKAIFSRSAVLGSALLLFTTVTLAQNSDKPGYDAAASEKARVRSESTGIVAGLVVGGLIAGPPGAIFTATAGALFGNNLSDRTHKRQLQGSLNAARAEYTALAEEKQVLEQQYQLAMQELQSSHFRPASIGTDRAVECCSDAAMTIHFRTSSAQIEPHYQNQLREFASLVKTVPDALVQITGYADVRGDSNSNMALSRERVASV